MSSDDERPTKRARHHRTLKSQSPPATDSKTLTPPKIIPKWQWEHRHTWKNFNPAQQYELEKSYTELKESSTVVTVGLSSFFIDFHKWTQRNAETNAVRRIRRFVEGEIEAVAPPLCNATPEVIEAYLQRSGMQPTLANQRFQKHCDEMKSIVQQWDAICPSEDANSSDLNSNSNSLTSPSCAEGSSSNLTTDFAQLPNTLEEIGREMRRDRRLMKEFRNLNQSDLRVSVGLVDDLVDRWAVKLNASHFPDSDLATDISNLKLNYPGEPKHVMLEVLFPPLYPRDPPFVRIVYPRFMYHTGHISWGGSVCLEALVNTGSPSGYSPSYTVENLLQMVCFNIANSDPFAGQRPGRVDFVREKEFDRLDYDLDSALTNFRRIVSQHHWDAQERVVQENLAAKGEEVKTWEETKQFFGELCEGKQEEGSDGADPHDKRVDPMQDL